MYNIHKSIIFITRFSILLLLLTFAGPGFSQIVTLSPSAVTGDEEVVLIYDAAQGNGDLVGASKIYIHAGIITDAPDGTDWQHVVGNWGLDDGIGQMTKVTGEDNKWQFTYTPTIRSYHSAPTSENIFRLAMVFRNADGTKKGAGNPGAINGGEVTSNGDIYMDLVVDSYVTITAPSESEFVLDENESFAIRAEASATAETITLFVDEGAGFQQIATASASSVIESEYLPTGSGTLKIKVTATIGGNNVEVTEEYIIVVSIPSPVADLPAGIQNGINYNETDDTKVTLSLLAPEKELIYVVGDFNNWEINEDYLMNITPDGEQFWIEVTNLVPRQEYVFQYWVDGVIKIGDPYADKVVDPWNDPFIPTSVYPDLPDYDKTDFGIASVLQTGQTAFSWDISEDTFTPPEKEDLVIYELLVRDFLGSHDYKDLVDSLEYLKALGVNAIELMPIMEFEGNESWGYNPSYFFAPDKYYGSKNDLKVFIQTAHQEGFAVILDMVLNHAFGQNAMVKMYWNSTLNRPAADNPWFNEEPTHPFNVGFDFNHESQYTKDFVDSVNLYWLSEYHFDGFRFDLSKGFTQTYNPTDVGKWGEYDQTRVDILSRMADEIWAFDSDAYVILEHFAESNEEQTLINLGMITWGNMNHTYKDILTTSNLSASGSFPFGKVAYMESHDEQRQKYYIDNGGGSQGTYDTRNFYTALERMKLGAAFFFPVPGPKMTWQFQELGYDIDIDFNGRVGNKPLPWGSNGLGYYEDVDRQKVNGAFSALLKLRNDYQQVFKLENFESGDSDAIRWYTLQHPDLEVVALGNFALEATETTQKFTKEGTWYDYFSAESVSVTDIDALVSLHPGEFHIYVDREITFPEGELIGAFNPIITTDPSSFDQTESIKIVFDAVEADPAGTSGLVGADKVYMHAGVILDLESSDWFNTVGNLGADDGVGQMQKVSGESDKWEITLTPEEYFAVSSDTRIYKLAMFFRNADDSNRGTDLGGEDLIIYVEADPNAEIVWTEPDPFGAKEQVTIFFDATLSDPAGTAGLVGVDKVYMHSGIVTTGYTGTEWENVVGNWGQDDGVGKMTKVAGQDNQWQISMTPWDYYSIADGTTVYRLGMVFRNEDGSREGKGPDGDIFHDVSSVTAIEDKVLEDIGVIVFPNPAKDAITFSFNNETSNYAFINIYNSLGMLVDSSSLPGNGKDFRYSNEKLKAGHYLIEMRGAGYKEVFRIVIDK
jgi:glycosidase